MKWRGVLYVREEEYVGCRMLEVNKLGADCWKLGCWKFCCG